MWRHHPQTRRLRELLDAGRDRPAAAGARVLLVPAPRGREHPPERRARRRRADGRRLLLRERRALRRGRRAGARVGRAGVSGARGSTSPSPPRCASPTTCSPSSTAASRSRHRHGLEAIGEDGSLYVADPWHGRSPGIVLTRGRRARDDRDRPRQPVHPRARELRARRPRRGAAAARPRGRARAGAHDRGALRGGGVGAQPLGRHEGRDRARRRDERREGAGGGEDGEIVGRAEVGYDLSTPQPGWAEQDPEDWWRGTQQALEELGAATSQGIGLSGQMHGSSRSTPTSRCFARRSSGTTSARRRSARRSTSASASRN